MNETTKEHTMTKQVHVSHASCDHDKTPAARAKCRRIRRGGAPESTKAQLVARIKDEIVEQRGTSKPKGVKKAKKKGKKDEPAVLRELLTLDAPEACEVEEPKVVEVNVIARGSKVVHTVSYDQDGEMLFACTKRPVNVDTAKITTNDVTCKNCLKLAAK